MKPLVSKLITFLFLLLLGAGVAAQPNTSGPASKAKGCDKNECSPRKLIMLDASGKASEFLPAEKERYYRDNKVSASNTDGKFTKADREQTCSEVCTKSCGRGGTDEACYWTCRWYCRPAMGGDPRKP